MNLLQQFEKEQLDQLTADKEIPDFGPGDTVRVDVKVVEGNRERVQAYEGVCIARKNDGINSSFTVRKISYGEGVERVFPLYSPNITITVVRHGIVRRAKLYYLRGLAGKKARIAEKIVRKTGAEIVPPKPKKEAAPKVETEEAASTPEVEVKTEAPKKEAAPKAEKKAEDKAEE